VADDESGVTKCACVRAVMPSSKLSRTQAFLREPHASVKRPRFEVAFEHWTRLCLERPGFVADAVWMIDSTPMWCFGAVLDTIRLLGDGLRSLGKRWARARKADLTTVALEWKEPLLLARSTKGYFEGTDWSDDAARSRTLAKLAETVTRVTELVLGGLGSVRENKREPLARLARNLVGVVDEEAGAPRRRIVADVDPGEGTGRLVEDVQAARVCGGDVAADLSAVPHQPGVVAQRARRVGGVVEAQDRVVGFDDRGEEPARARGRAEAGRFRSDQF
jgi:hypothetical protein